MGALYHFMYLLCKSLPSAAVKCLWKGVILESIKKVPVLGSQFAGKHDKNPSNKRKKIKATAIGYVEFIFKLSPACHAIPQPAAGNRLFFSDFLFI